MIKSNLAVLLAERNLKVSKVASDTGISRTTLTSLVYNHSQGIQFDTMNKLCLYLRVTPEQLFSFVPFDIEVISSGNSDLVIDINIKDNGKLLKFKLHGIVDKNISSDLESLEIFIFLNDEDNETNAHLIKYLKMLPPSFLKEIEEVIFNSVLGEIEEQYNLPIQKNIYSSFDWPKELYQ